MKHSTFLLHMTYDERHRTKLPYVNMGVKISFNTSTMQPPASTLSKVHYNILKLKNKKWSNFFCIFWNFLCIFEPNICTAQRFQKIKRLLSSDSPRKTVKK